jgi:hypothetical protein
MPRARVAIAVAFFAYVVLIRTYDITSTFLMLGEQTRDWTIALGGWRDIPLSGTPSTAGGRGFGPAYYWILWLGRHLVGPFTSNLPHAGGLTVALLQSAADTWLLVALWRRVPIALALAMCLLIASAPFDIGLSSVIWNPPVSAALVKMAIAQLITLREQPPLWRVGTTAATAWLAVQAHSSAIFVGAPLVAALVAQPLVVRKWRRALQFGALVVAVILVLQVPYIVAQFREPEAEVGPTVVFDSMANAAKLEVVKAFTAVVNTTGELLVHRMESWTFQIPTFIAAAIVAWRWRRDAGLLAVSAGALATATFLFSTWTRPYDSYWFLTLTPAMVLTFGLAVAAIPRAPIVRWTSLALLAIVIVWQPSRVEESKGFFKYPEYRAMLVGSRELARRAPVLRDIRVAFAVHPTMDKYFIYRILGGRIAADGAHTAHIQPDGRVTLDPVP